jgi:hypothetical protein
MFIVLHEDKLFISEGIFRRAREVALGRNDSKRIQHQIEIYHRVLDESTRERQLFTNTTGDNS